MAIVRLAGYNIDIDQLELVLAGEKDKRVLTPESISAAYARISRSSKDVTELRRKAADHLIKARISNTKIVHEMGHHSIAEHTVFNFDIIGVSRLGLEWLEMFRLISETEKSQRYVTMEGDLVIPKEFDDGERGLYLKITKDIQNKFYSDNLPILIKYQNELNPGLNDKLIEGLAKEDDRYVLSLGTKGQVGMTINARNLEYMIKMADANPYLEIRELGKKLRRLGSGVAPSLIKNIEAKEYFKDGQSNLERFFEKEVDVHRLLRTMELTRIIPPPTYDGVAENSMRKKGEAKLINYTPDADNKIVAALIRSGTGLPIEKAYLAATYMSDEAKKNMIKARLNGIEKWDAVPREFEMVDIVFEADISASNFAQLKRHRMATLLPGKYDLSLGVTMPESIKATGLERKFMEVIEKTNNAYYELRKTQPTACNYILTNAHRRSVVMKMNLRELHHFSRLREDEHAQWDIRYLANSIVEQTKEVMPIITSFIGGKHEFESIKNKLYNPESS